MKKILIILLTILSCISYGQDSTITYPHYSIENGKKTVVFTLEQAQRIDNDRQLLAHFRELGADFNSVDSACVKVVDAQGKEINGLKIEISSLKSLGITKDSEIDNLKAQISQYKIKDDLNKKELKTKDDIISEKDLQIRKQKRQKWAGFIGGGLSVIGLVFLLIRG
jgi:hypothetical protein